MNKRYISYLTFSPFDIFFDFDHTSILDKMFQSHQRCTLILSFQIKLHEIVSDEDSHAHRVLEYFLQRNKKRKEFYRRSEYLSDLAAQKYDLEVNVLAKIEKLTVHIQP